MEMLLIEVDEFTKSRSSRISIYKYSQHKPILMNSKKKQVQFLSSSWSWASKVSKQKKNAHKWKKPT